VQLPDSTHGVVRRPAGGPVRRFVATHLGSRQVSRVIYGAIIGLALVVGLEAHPPAPSVVIATLLGTAVAVALAEMYSEVVGFETGERRKASLSQVRHLGADVVAVAFGIAFPGVFFVLAAAGVLENDAAFRAAKWTGLGLIGLYGFAGARLSGAGVLVSVMHAVGVALIGALLIALKALVH
jgi:basic membrane lipoprotein Med (substrate-binding protein (PBP1-ABC) superfamily)